MRISLSAKNKIGFINETIKRSEENHDTFQTWERCNHMVLSWILNSVDSNIASSSIYTESATNQEITELRQGHQSASIYYTKMKALWEELSSYHDPITCTCGGLKGFAEREEKERVIQFLMSLNDFFSITRGSILLMNHLPDTRKVHALILQHERQSDVAANRNNSGHVVNFAQPKIQNQIGSRQVTEAESHYLMGNKRLYYTNSEMDGHTIDRRFYIHGFPLGHRYHGKDIKPKGKKSINSSVVPNIERSETKQLTTKEYDQIMALLRKDISNTEPLINTSGIDSIYASSTWILDSSAIDHDLTTKKTIGLSKQSNGLYYLTVKPIPHLCSTINHTFNLWHKRLGHPTVHPLWSLSTIPNISLESSNADYSLFTQVCGNSFTIILLYVDDMNIVGNDQKAINNVKVFLATCFKFKDLGMLKYFLGIEVARSKMGISINQHKYTLDLLQEAGLLGAKPAKFPMEQSLKLTSNNGNLLKDPMHYG
ncbi:uncharacterized protein LOC121972952 [Zingiber officinale]|uniref:uncharacterized protein LOC121972952 n=1 Tax=Zingiber officinale TaxID=94328 RepID=UPI001C4AF747|nr:uncharacterized protein LOC121972952 [Zingiber officinale]